MESALQRARSEVETLAMQMEITVGTSAARIIRAHELVFEDATFVAAESALSITVDEYVQQLIVNRE
jgi:phosphoenolpyruvate-protein kinase (PTS system EI component)